VKLITFVQPNQNQQDCLCEDRARPNVEDHRSLLTTCSVNAKMRNVNKRRQQTTQTTAFSGPSIRSIQSFPHQAVVKILILMIAKRPKASEHCNFDMKSSKYRILQIRKLHRRSNFTMRPCPQKSINKRSKAMWIRWELDIQNQRHGCQTRERLEYQI
jgi:hypothetical protein